VKIKLYKLIQALPALETLSIQKFPASTTLKVMRSMRAIRPEIEDYDKLKNDLIIKYGTKDGDNTVVKPEQMGEFLKEINPVLEDDVDLFIDKLPLSILTVDFSAKDLELLEWLIDFEN
jgi:hypothetical protein